MHATNASSVSVFKTGLRFGRVMFAGVFIFAMAATAQGQATTPKPHISVKQPHWHKYVSREYGFSFWYPDAYRPTDADGRCKDDDYRRFLLCLEGRDDPDASIWVTIIIAQPFQLIPDVSDSMPKRKLIGRHVFYCKIVGSMGVGFQDHYDLNLRGKDLEFGFDPAQMPPTAATPAFELKILKTFRTF